MGVILLDDLRMEVESYSYIDAMHAIMLHQGWIIAPKFMLTGMTAMGFRFTVNRRLTEESPTAYNWIAENFLAADFVGVVSSQQAGYCFDATFLLYQKKAISEIKQSLNRGVGAVFWKDQFVIATGYNDNKQVLFYSNGKSNEHETLPYVNFGKNKSPYWYYQILEKRIDLEKTVIYKESFMQAVYKWETHDTMLPEKEYACGRRSYDAIIQSLQTGDYDQESVGQVFNCYAAAKRDIALYTTALHRYWPQSGTVAEAYSRLNHIYEQVAETKDVKQLVLLFMEANEVEEQAIKAIKKLMRETIDNRFNNIGLR